MLCTAGAAKPGFISGTESRLGACWAVFHSRWSSVVNEGESTSAELPRREGSARGRLASAAGLSGAQETVARMLARIQGWNLGDSWGNLFTLSGHRLTLRISSNSLFLNPPAG